MTPEEYEKQLEELRLGIEELRKSPGALKIRSPITGELILVDADSTQELLNDMIATHDAVKKLPEEL